MVETPETEVRQQRERDRDASGEKATPPQPRSVSPIEIEKCSHSLPYFEPSTGVLPFTSGRKIRSSFLLPCTIPHIKHPRTIHLQAGFSAPLPFPSAANGLLSCAFAIPGALSSSETLLAVSSAELAPQVRSSALMHGPT